MRVAEWLSLRGDADPLERIVQTYEADAGPEPNRLVRYWEKIGPGHSPSVLAALVKVDLHRRFEAGERPKILDYLREFPVLAEDHDRVVSLVYEEFCLLEENGERPDSLDFCDDYSRWRDSLHSQLDYHRELSLAINAEAPVVEFPKPGDRFDRYRLTSLLGVGGVARVYLATEEEIGLQIAIKVSASFGQEPSILAQLNHRNIVPVFMVATAESGLRGMCMPYRPGVTLEELIRRIGRGKPPRSARAISQALRPATVPAEFPPEQQTEGWKEFPVQRMFPEAVAWLGLALANALSYMHQRGVFHRDIKPANILLALIEGPQLLDFNLAQVPSNAQGATAAKKGGTLPYMAPEQLKAFLDPSAWDDVGAAADLYSLGLVLRELLTGRPPELPTSQGSLAREIQSLLDRRAAPAAPIGEINPGVPPALESIVEKCLAHRPENRYADAEGLAADLRRFLERKPLAVAPNTSKFELGVNWIYRNRKSLASAIVLVAVVASLVGLYRLLKPEELTVDARFSAAEVLLDSGLPRNLERAREEFQSLHVEFPKTARSSLGMALTLEKLGDEPGSIKYLTEAAKAADAEPVIERRLLAYPKSALLYRTLGYVQSKTNKALARRSIEKSVTLDRTSFHAFVYLAKLDEDEKRPRDAVGHLEQALEVCKNPAIAHGYRKYVLQLLVNLIEESIESRSDQAELDRQHFESGFHSFRSEAKKLSTKGENPRDTYALAYFEGCLKSIQGVFEPDPDQAHRRFNEADGCFDRAKAVASTHPKAVEELPSLDVQQKLLTKRRAAKPTATAQPAP